MFLYIVKRLVTGFLRPSLSCPCFLGKMCYLCLSTGHQCASDTPLAGVHGFKELQQMLLNFLCFPELRIPYAHGCIY